MDILSKLKMRYSYHFFNEDGFTLFELLVVTAIIGTLSAILFFNFRSFNDSITARNQTVAAVIADIRSAQAMTTSSTLYIDDAGTRHIVCGYGLHYAENNVDYASFVVPSPSNNSNINGNSYIVYGKLRPDNLSTPEPEDGRCNDIVSRNYETSDFVVKKIIMANPKMEIKARACPSNSLSFAAADIFFEAPDPTIYIDNRSVLNARSAVVTVRKKSISTSCSDSYAAITVATSGYINVESR